MPSAAIAGLTGRPAIPCRRKRRAAVQVREARGLAGGVRAVVVPLASGKRKKRAEGMPPALSVILEAVADAQLQQVGAQIGTGGFEIVKAVVGHFGTQGPSVVQGIIHAKTNQPAVVRAKR